MAGLAGSVGGGQVQGSLWLSVLPRKSLAGKHPVQKEGFGPAPRSEAQMLELAADSACAAEGVCFLPSLVMK